MAERGLDYLHSTNKRQFDVMGGFAVATALSPVATVSGLASAIDTRSVKPWFFQERVGGNYRQTFRILKLRTLAMNPGEQTGTESYGTFDPRASKLGQFIRQIGLDEAPQLLNVLKGDMSLVGTRPLPAGDLEHMEAAHPELFEDWYAYFQAVKPGLIGESQMYRHHYRILTNQVLANSMRMDLDYFESASLQQDIKWLLSTPVSMLRANIGIIENIA